MRGFQQRVINEADELCARIGKLDGFLVTDLFRSLPEEEQERLWRQRAYMMGYGAVLHERIAAFVHEPESAPEASTVYVGPPQ